MINFVITVSDNGYKRKVRGRMIEDKEKYLVVTECEDIDAKCSNCSNAGISLYYYPYAFECVEKIAEVHSCANVKILGIYKKVEQFTIDKDLNIKEKLNG